MSLMKGTYDNIQVSEPCISLIFLSYLQMFIVSTMLQKKLKK
jgi:hypothetical protein